MRRPLTGLAPLGAVLICVLTVAACTGSTTSDASAEPWNDPNAVWMQPAGTPLTAGITVPEGASLVGPIFTLLDDQSASVGWQRGYLLADADPYAVSSAFVSQWDGEDGLGDYHRDTLCRQEVDEGVDGKTRYPDYTGNAEAGAVQISCTVGLVLRAPKGDNELAQIRTGRDLSFDLAKDVTAANVPAQGTVGWQTPFLKIPTELPVAPDGVSGPSSVTGDSDGVPPLEVVDGSFLAGPSWPGSNGGYVAIIGVTGDPDEVFDRYVEQHPGEPYFDADTVVDGLRVRVFRSAEAGGVLYSVTLNEIDGNAWILVSAQND